MPAPKKVKGNPPLDQWAPRHEDCWAKTMAGNEPGINVRDHCLNVGCVAEALLSLMPAPLRRLFPPGAVVLAALHDVGKVSPGFQQKSSPWLARHNLIDRAHNEAWCIRESDHARISQHTVQDLVGKSKLFHWAAALGAHHGRIKGESVQLAEPWHQERRRLAEELIREFGPTPDEPLDLTTPWLVAGLISISDWIGSDERLFPQEANWDMPERRRQAEQSLRGISWKYPKVRRLQGFAELFPEVPSANSLQISTMETIREPGIYVIEGPMGCGKTEAALSAAYRMIAEGKATGLYFALPTQVTSNRIHIRIQPFVNRITLEQSPVRLAHSASWLAAGQGSPQLRAAIGDAEGQFDVRAAHSWFASAKRALLEPYGVGTIDQALLGVVAANHFFVRQFGLAGKVVVLDEVHTYDLYTGTLIDVLVQRLLDLGCTVIVLSATLTQTRRRQLLQLPDDKDLSTAYPLVSGTNGSLAEIPCDEPAAKRVTIRFVEARDLIDESLDRASKGQCVLWIRNTVDEAQATYRELRSSRFEGGPEVALLHSRFPFFRREQLECDWMERLGKGSTRRPDGCILVSTQVAEQSVDIDADLLISDLAPTDMLLQRIGRLWRHERHRPAGWKPEAWICSFPLSDKELMDATEKQLREALGKSGRVYAPYVLLRSLQQWRCRGAITLPTDIRAIIEATYAEPLSKEPDALRQLRNELEERKRQLRNMAISATRIWAQPPLPDEEGIQTRISSLPTAGLLLVRSVQSLDARTALLQLLDGSSVQVSDRQWDLEAAKAICRNLTRVPWWVVRAALEMPKWLNNHVSQPTALGLLQSDGFVCWRGSDAETGISYQEDQGIVVNRKRLPKRPPEEFDESYD